MPEADKSWPKETVEPKEEMRAKDRMAGGVLRVATVASLVVFLLLVQWGVDGAGWRMKATAAQSWQLKSKRGRVGATPGDAVTYEDLDASIEALQQYLNMHDVQIARLEEQQKASVRRLESLEGAKIDARLEHLETIVGENQVWLRMAVAGVATTALGVAAQILLHLKKGRRRE